jgi:hypothetical protein
MIGDSASSNSAQTIIISWYCAPYLNILCGLLEPRIFEHVAISFDGLSKHIVVFQTYLVFVISALLPCYIVLSLATPSALYFRAFWKSKDRDNISSFFGNILQRFFFLGIFEHVAILILFCFLPCFGFPQ